MKQIVVNKGRTTVVTVSVGADISQDTITSEIRVDKSRSSDLIVAWAVTKYQHQRNGDNSCSTFVYNNLFHLILH